MDFQQIIAGTVGKENTYGTLDGTVKAGAMSFARFSTDDFEGTIKGYVGEGNFTNDPLNTFGGAGVVEIPNMQELLRYICENGFEHHVAANFATVAAPSTKPAPSTSAGLCTGINKAKRITTRRLQGASMTQNSRQRWSHLTRSRIAPCSLRDSAKRKRPSP